MGERTTSERQSAADRLHPPTVTVPPTTEGVAAALSVAPAGLATIGPERSHPAYRSHPPLFAVGEELHVPSAVRSLVPDTDIVFRLPDDLSSLFVAAPLAYYLGASVEVGADQPTLVAPGVERAFDPLPTFQYEVARLLRRALLVDTLVRNVPGEGVACATGALDALDRCPAELREGTPSERLRATLEADAAALAEHLPEWHLAAYVDPGHENVPALSHLLEDLAMVYLARAEPLDERGLLKRALDDFYRAPEGPIANVDMVAPTLEDADLHGWLADGVPVEAFTPTAAAYEHRIERSTATEPLDVAVVLNDAAMVAEHDEVGRIYRDADRSADVVVYEDIPTASLARVFEDDHDFVHFIGHCEEGGLRCPDGLLDVESLCSVGARTFFLNACGSFYQGHALVERGSVAGAVTLRGVLNEPAARVGTTFARLLIEGFCIGRALSLARRRITMSTDYVAVGDGTYALASDESPLASLDRVADGYHVEYTVPATRHVGGYFEDPFDGCERLRGTAATTTVSPGDLPGVLDMLDCPVVHDGELRWSRDLAAILRGR